MGNKERCTITYFGNDICLDSISGFGLEKNPNMHLLKRNDFFTNSAVILETHANRQRFRDLCNELTVGFGSQLLYGCGCIAMRACF